MPLHFSSTKMFRSSSSSQSPRDPTGLTVTSLCDLHAMFFYVFICILLQSNPTLIGSEMGCYEVG